MPTAAAIYSRISLDKQGTGLGVQRQEQLCRDLAEHKGWPVAEVYVDNDQSASSGRPRPAYQRMLAAIEAGAIDAVIVVDLDRLTRRPAELEEFIDLADRHKVALANVAGDTDLTTSDGRFKARIMGAVARQEGEKKGERMRREREQHARDGKPHGGGRPFGFADDRVTIREPEAAMIREAAQRVIAGETTYAITRDWNARGLVTATGKPWHTQGLATVLRNPRIAGLRTYKGEVVKEAVWDPIIDRQTHERVVAALGRRAGPGRPGSRPLVGILRCGLCGATLYVNARTNKGRREHRYGCLSAPGKDGCGRIVVAAAPVEDLVRDLVVAALAGPALADARKRVAGDDQREAKAAGDLADAETRLDELAADYADGTITRREWLTARERLERRIGDARKVLDRNGNGMLATLPADADALRAAWKAGDVEWKRALVRTVIDRIDIAPATKRGPKLDPDRVVPGIVWRV